MYLQIARFFGPLIILVIVVVVLGIAFGIVFLYTSLRDLFKKLPKK